MKSVELRKVGSNGETKEEGETKTTPNGPKKAPRSPKRFHPPPQVNASQLCSMLVILLIDITFASSQEAINKVQQAIQDQHLRASELPSLHPSQLPSASAGFAKRKQFATY